MRLKEKAKKKKGRGFGSDVVHREPMDYESVRDDTNDEAEPGPQRCKYRNLSISKDPVTNLSANFN